MVIGQLASHVEWGKGKSLPHFLHKNKFQMEPALKGMGEKKETITALNENIDEYSYDLGVGKGYLPNHVKKIRNFYEKY